MHNSRRSPDGLHPGAQRSDELESQTRLSGYRRRYHRRYDDRGSEGVENRRDYSWASRHVDHDDTRGRSYCTAQDESYLDAHYRHTDRRIDDSHKKITPEMETGIHIPRRSGEETSSFAGPSIPVKPRELSPESPPPPIPTSPSPEYLKIASELPKPIDSPPKKLIILDLNGTLLVRVRSLGAVYPRPYMPAFRDFLFCPATRQWLDVMIWSSAQPHNVERMVRRCFFDPRLGPPVGESALEENDQADEEDEKDKWNGKLIAVWARDTLGLSRSDYSRKAQTTKDLDKPWSALEGDHDAHTTVLLDDSTKKARLQPFNHVCINEYNITKRNHDMSIKRRAQKDIKEFKKPDGSDEMQGEQTEEKPALIEGDEKEVQQLTDKEKKRKQRKAEKKKRHATVHDDAQRTEEGQPQEYDSTLLAVIGILDALKQESNVAAWIRAGGLWAGKAPPTLDGSVLGEAVHEEPGERAPSPTDLEVGEEASVPRPVSPSVAKRQRSMGYDVAGVSGGDIKRTKFSAKEEAVDHEEPVAAGNDAQTVGAVIIPNESSAPPVENGIKADGDGSSQQLKRAKMWFEDEETFRTWVTRGRAALKRLGIEERDGIIVD